MLLRAFAAFLSLFAILTGSDAARDPALKTTSTRDLVWSDEFAGATGASPNKSRWTFATGGGGWGNHELQCYTTSRNNSATNGQGHLIINAVRTDAEELCPDGNRNAFTSARITTQASFTVTHGRLEIRAKLPYGAGTWPAFWALGANLPKVGWPRSGEIDVMEYSGNRPTVTTSAVHAASYLGTHWHSSRTSPPSTTLSSQFHVYAVEWTSDSLTFYRDKSFIGRITRSEVVRYGAWPFDKPFFLLVNLAMGGTYGGPVPASVTSPQRYAIDYVRVYR